LSFFSFLFSADFRFLLTCILYSTRIECYTWRKFHDFEGKDGKQIEERYRSELRAATLSAARDLIKEEGYEGLTLRKLARRMQCSPMALYTYFADKQLCLLLSPWKALKNWPNDMKARAGENP